MEAIIQRFTGQDPKPINYRGRGLGTAIVKMLIQFAMSRGLLQVKGSLSPHDLKDNPGLPDWYRRRGFEVLPGGNFGLGSIRMLLSQEC